MNHAVLAVVERNTTLFRNMGSGFRAKQENFNPAELVWWVLLLVAVFAGLSLLSRMLARRDKRRLYNSPRALFRALCRVHDLDASNRRLIRQLATHHGLADPSQAFLSPECFDAVLSSGGAKNDADRLMALRKKLFGDWHQADWEKEEAQAVALALALEAWRQAGGVPSESDGAAEREFGAATVPEIAIPTPAALPGTSG